MQRQQINVKVTEAGLERIDQIKDETGSTRADVVRTTLGLALSDGVFVTKLKTRLGEQL